MQVVSLPTAQPGRRRRIMTTLFVAQVCGSTGHSMSLAVGAIVAAEITGTNVWSGMPVAIGALGAALASWPLSSLMERLGRRPGLALGYGVAALGAALGTVGVMTSSFLVMLIGMALFGVGNTSNLLGRYAAADVTEASQRGRAMGLIVWGSTAGSIAGPNLMPLATGLGHGLGLTPAGSAFLISVAGYSVAMVLSETFLRPDPLAIARHAHDAATAGRPGAPSRPIATVLGDLRVRIALVTLVTSQLVMIGTTSTSPLYLHDQGHHVKTIGVAVALHLAGMYVASPLSGWMSDRFGRIPTIAAGGVGLIAAVMVAGLVPGHDGALVIFGLFLNGIGWNMAFVSGSALLTDALRPAERTSLQGLADLVMGLAGALGSATGGIVLGAWGFSVLNALGALLVLAPLAAIWLARRVGPTPQQG